MASILFAEGQTAKGAKRQMRSIRDRWIAQLQRGLPDDRESSRILTKWCAQTKNYWSGLFYCYSDPRIPATNNSLERFIKEMKQMVRLMCRSPNPSNRFAKQAPLNSIAVTRPTLPDKKFLAQRGAAAIIQAEAAMKRRRRKLGASQRVRRNITTFTNGVVPEWEGACGKWCEQRTRAG